MRKIILILGGLLISCSTFADHHFGVLVGAFTHHPFTTQPDGATPYNNDSDLLAIQYNQWHAGRFMNSYHHESYFVGRMFETSGKFRVGVSVNVVTGYDKRVLDVFGKHAVADESSYTPETLLMPGLHATKSFGKTSLTASFFGGGVNWGLSTNFDQANDGLF